MLDKHLYASVEQAGGVHDDHGHYAELVYAGCATRERAEEIKRALYRAGVRLGLSVSAWIIPRDGEYDVHYKAIDKTMARKHVLEKYGPDRSKWPYDPRKKGR
ncbi:MAG TPA: hypothetical protein VKV80_06310 [Streptosporangiaceae bacterium]|nr:hypothetical protein [Streptosporangiaceae bacterium]